MDIAEKTFSDEVELKKFLLDYGFIYGTVGSSDKYVIVYRDNKSGALIYQGIYDSPIVALRDLNTILPQIKLPLKDVMVQLVLAFNPSDMKKKPVQFTDLVILDPFMYFDKPKKEDVEVVPNSSDN